MGRSGSKKWDGLTQKNVKVSLENMRRTGWKKWKGLTQKNRKECPSPALPNLGFY